MNWLSFGSGFVAGLASGTLLKKLLSSVTGAIQGFYKTLLDSTRQMFNKAVEGGEFSMPEQIRVDETEYRNNPRKLNSWFTRYAKTHSYKGLMIQGHLYYMHHYDPLTKDKLEFYDITPLALSFGSYLAETGNIVQYAINLHMLPKEIRIRFLIDIFELFKKQYSGKMYSNEPRKINEFSWETLKRFIDKYHIDFAVRSYIPERMQGVVCFDYQDWGKALVLAGNYIGINEHELRRRYLQYIRTSKLKRGIQ